MRATTRPWSSDAWIAVLRGPSATGRSAVTLRSRPSAAGGISSSGVLGGVGQHDLQPVELLQPLGEPGRAFVVEPVAQPDDIGAGVELELVDLVGRDGAVGRPRLGPEGAQDGAHLVGPQRALAHGRRVERRGRGADQRDQPAGAFGALDQPLGVGDAGRPARRRRPAVVDHQQERSLARQLGLRIEQRPRDREDQRRRQQQAQQQQPPRHLHRRLLAGLEPDQQPDRRKADQLRQRRDQAQQPVDHRQHQQQRQHAGSREGERAEAQHEAQHASWTRSSTARSGGPNAGSPRARRCAALEAVATLRMSNNDHAAFSRRRSAMAR